MQKKPIRQRLAGAAHAQTAPDVARAEPPAAAAAADTVATVIVTGTRLQNRNFTAPTPVQVLTSATIEARAPTNIADVVNENPAFRISRSSKGSGRIADQQQGVQSLLDLRGLGDVRTLVLINGHRHVGTVSNGSVDTNIIPVGLVDRVETVTGGASAAYGSDAVAGVTNFILKNQMRGVSGSVQTSRTGHGDGVDYVGTFAAGLAFDDDRGHVIVGGDASHSDGVGNIYSRDYGAVEPGLVSPSAALRASAGLPATMFLNNVEIGTSAPGGLITTALGGNLYAFDAAGAPTVFSQGTLYGANMVGSRANYGYNPLGAFQLQNENSRQVLYGRVEYDLSDKLQVFAEANYGHTELPKSLTAEYVTAFTLSTANPYLPAATRALLTAAGRTSFTLGRINTDFGGNTTWQSNDVKRAVIGARGAVFGDWSWEAYYQSGRTEQDFNTSGLVLSALYKAVYGCDGTATNPNLNAASRTLVASYEALTGKTCAVFNPFGVNQGSAAAYGYFLNDQHQDTKVGQDVASASLSGSPFALPAGEVSLAVGAEYRKETLDVVSAIPATGYFTLGNFTTYGGSNTVKEGFAEIGVPVLKDLPLAKSLDFNAAVRRTDYRLSGAVTTWKAGLTYEPIDAVRFRLTRSRDIRAPNLNELNFIGGGTTSSVINPFNGVTAQTTVQGAGNPNLVPEIADTFTTGVVFQPAGALSGLRASIDYYKVEVTGAIVRLSAQQTLNQCYAGVTTACSAITFDTSTLGISYIVNRSANVNALVVEGVDFEVGYRTSSLPGNIPGAFEVRALVNHALHNQVQTLAGTIENAGAATGLPSWTGNLTFGYDIGRLSVDLQFRGFTKVKYDPSLQGPEDANYVVTATTSINKNRFPGMIYTNLSMQYGVTDKVKLFGVVNNLLDHEPPAYSLIAITGGGRQLNYDMLGREYKLGVRFAF